MSHRFGERAASCAWIRYEPGQDTQDSFALDRLNRKMDRLNARMDRSRNEYGKNRSSSRRERPLRPTPQAVRQEKRSRCQTPCMSPQPHWRSPLAC